MPKYQSYDKHAPNAVSFGAKCPKCDSTDGDFVGYIHTSTDAASSASFKCVCGEFWTIQDYRTSILNQLRLYCDTGWFWEDFPAVIETIDRACMEAGEPALDGAALRYRANQVSTWTNLTAAKHLLESLIYALQEAIVSESKKTCFHCNHPIDPDTAHHSQHDLHADCVADMDEGKEAHAESPVFHRSEFE
jgi:hypothetical protein